MTKETFNACLTSQECSEMKEVWTDEHLTVFIKQLLCKNKNSKAIAVADLDIHWLCSQNMQITECTQMKQKSTFNTIMLHIPLC